MLRLPAIMIERPFDDEGAILEPVTERDILQALKVRFGLEVNLEDIYFRCDRNNAGLYQAGEGPLELGLFSVEIAGLSEPLHLWVVPLEQTAFEQKLQKTKNQTLMNWVTPVKP